METARRRIGVTTRWDRSRKGIARALASETVPGAGRGSGLRSQARQLPRCRSAACWNSCRAAPRCPARSRPTPASICSRASCASTAHSSAGAADASPPGVSAATDRRIARGTSLRKSSSRTAPDASAAAAAPATCRAAARRRGSGAKTDSLRCETSATEDAETSAATALSACSAERTPLDCAAASGTGGAASGERQ